MNSSFQHINLLDFQIMERLRPRNALKS